LLCLLHVCFVCLLACFALCVWPFVLQQAAIIVLIISFHVLLATSVSAALAQRNPFPSSLGPSSPLTDLHERNTKSKVVSGLASNAINTRTSFDGSVATTPDRISSRFIFEMSSPLAC